MTEILIASLLGGLVVYRGWRIVGQDQITEPVRARIPWTWLDDLVSCPWCLGFWVSMLWAGLVWVLMLPSWGPLEAGACWLATSAVAGLLSGLNERMTS